MKLDEYKMVLGNTVGVSDKRREYILGKWEKRGWYYGGAFTESFHEVKDLVINRDHNIREWDGRVVILEFIRERSGGRNDATGIIEDHGDNGRYFHNGKERFYLGGHEFPTIAYARLHPAPRKIWIRMNAYSWKKYGIEDCFHQKITTMSPGTVCDHSRASEGIYSYSHPLGNIGDCLPWCQCKMLGD